MSISNNNKNNNNLNENENKEDTIMNISDNDDDDDDLLNNMAYDQNTGTQGGSKKKNSNITISLQDDIIKLKKEINELNELKENYKKIKNDINSLKKELINDIKSIQQDVAVLKTDKMIINKNTKEIEDLRYILKKSVTGIILY